MELNITYLMKRESRRLHSIIRLLDSAGNLVEKTCLRMDLSDEFLFSDTIKNFLISGVTDNVPFISCVNHLYIYAAISVNDHYFVVGPIKYNSNYCIKNNLDINLNSSFLDELSKSTAAIAWNDFIDSLLNFANMPLANSSAHQEITETDIVNANCLKEHFKYQLRKDLERKIFLQQETGQHHNPYDQEIRELSAIERGDIEALEKSLAEDYTGQLGVLSKNKLQNIKNIAIIVIATSSRAAIKGGLSPEIAFSMADLYSQQIDEATSENVPMQITRNAEFEFAKMVHELKSENTTMNSFSGDENEHVMAAKNYIFRHLHGKITVSDISEALGLNSNYLSGLFKKNEGITLKEYILNNKIVLVKNLLTYSAYNYSEISYYLGFASQSHLGKKFKEKTGMTLSQYRSKYQLQEFLD